MYDINNDGFITQDDLVENLKLMVGDNFTEEQITSIAAQTLETYDLDKDGKINPKEFNEVHSLAVILFRSANLLFR